MEEKPDSKLIAEFKSGDRGAITQLFERHYPSCLRLARGILRSDDQSQDAVQTAYMSAAFTTWIKRIVINCCLMQIRRPDCRAERMLLDDSGTSRSVDLLVSATVSPEEFAWRGEIAAAHSHATAVLPVRLREVYLLCAVSGLTVKQAAAQLGATIPAVKTRLFRARAEMRRRLRPLWPANGGARVTNLRRKPA